jgi:hypothetical protein
MEKKLQARSMMLTAIALCTALSLATLSLRAQDKGGISVTVQNKDGSDAGLILSAEATAKEVGLPMYPGARPHKEEGNDSPAAKLGLWGSSFGFKLVVLKLESNDAPEKIAAFYQKALARYGKVLDCSNNPAGGDDKNKKSESKELTCQDDRPDPGGKMFKSGTKEKQHIVGIKPNGQGSLFQLVYLEARSEEKKPA